jgi:hypothetical protein
MVLIKDLFKNKLIQWEFRGNPEMWDKLKTSFGSLENNFSQFEFENELIKHFYEFIELEGEKSSNKTNSVKFENFSQRGMSGGYISLDWWEETGLSLLKNRYLELSS